MTHAQLVSKAVEWLRRYGCGIVLSEQACVSGEVPDAIGWKGACRSVVVECKLSRSDFLADRAKPFRQNSELGLGCERWYLTPAGLLSAEDLPRCWGLLESRAGKLQVAVKASRQNQRTPAGLIRQEELPAGWGLLELRGGKVEMLRRSARNHRSITGFGYEMNLLLASLRRVELRIEPQSITEFLKWQNRMAEYNQGALPEGMVSQEEEANVFLEA